MKRIFLTIGFLLLPLSVHAEALSPWVQGVLDRADEGIRLAEGLTFTSCDDVTVQSEIKNNQSIIRELSSPALQREAEVEFLRESTVCFQSDKHLLELKIREVQEAMSTAVENCKVTTTKALRENYRFLLAAYESFVRGGNNPLFSNDVLRYRYSFHDSNLWNEGVVGPVTDIGSTAPICPYTTDYGVHSIGFLPTAVGQGAGSVGSAFDIRSFGCDKTVLETIPAPFDREANTLKEFMDRTDDLSASLYDTVSQTLFNLNTVIGQLTQSLPTTQAPGAKEPPPHGEETGCLRPMQPNFGADSQAEIDALLATYPDYFESYNFSDNDTGFSYSPPPGQILPTGMLHLPVIDYFQSTPNAGILTRAYIDLREKVGVSRPLPTFLMTEMFSYLMVLTRTSDATNNMITISGNIEREMGILESSSTDALQRMQDASVPLESAVQSLIQVVDTELPQKYIPALTYFLARSCVDGHCQRTLDAVAKRTFNPYCHPYVSGLYLEEDAHKRCFCDPSLETEDRPFWKKYCSADFSEDSSRYDNVQPVLIPACVEESRISL